MCLLGGLRVICGDKAVTRFKTGKTAGLLAYLAYFPARVHRREALAEMLWPDADPTDGRTNLRSCLASLSRQLEPEGSKGWLLLADNTVIQLNPAAFSTDAAEFESCLIDSRRSGSLREKIQSLTHAIDLYAGDLLPGWYVEWIGPERQRLAEEHVNALLSLAQASEQAGEIERAIPYALKVVKSEPLFEEAYQILMRLYAAFGQPSRAMQQYYTLRRIFKQQLGGEPSAETRALAKQIRRDPAAFVLDLPAASNEASTLSFASPAFPTRRRRLPAPITRFFGREAEIAHGARLLKPSIDSNAPNTRLLTLTGMGGAGKTRFAIEIARHLADEFRGVWFVPLSEIDRPDFIPDAILSALGSPRPAHLDPVDQIIKVLGDESALLVLDNFEQLLRDDSTMPDGAMIVNSLLERAAGLRCLVTSRRRLELAGEYELPVPMLDVPLAVDTPARLMRFPAVQLFVDRARARRVDFAVTPRNAVGLVELCKRLEGIPLALELAAAQAHNLSPAQILEQVERRLDALSTEYKNVPERQRTLRATLMWSVRLLSAEFRRFFAQVSVFRGGWTLEAAQAVCKEADAEACLRQIRNHSLVATEEAGGETRFRLYDIVREFAAEMLSAEEQAEMAARHLHFYLSLAQQASPMLEGPEESLWLNTLEREIDNLRAGLSWSLENDCRTCVRLTGLLHSFWYTRGHLREGFRWMQAVLERCPDLDESVRSRAYNGAGVFAWRLGDMDQAERHLEAALAIRQGQSDHLAVAGLLNNLGLLAHHRGDFDRARERFQQSIDIYRRLSDLRLLGNALDNASVVAIDLDDLDSATALLDESESLLQAIGDRSCLASVQHHRGVAERKCGRIENARQRLRESFSIYRELKERTAFPGLLVSLGTLALDLNRCQDAVWLYAAATAACEAVDARLSHSEQATLDAGLQAARHQLDGPTISAVWSLGKTATLDDVMTHVD